MGYCARKEIETLGGRLMMGQEKREEKKKYCFHWTGAIRFTIFTNIKFNE